MPTPNERKGLWFLALVALSGTGVRVWRAHAPTPPATAARALDRQIGRVDSTRTANRAKRAARDSAKTSKKNAPKAQSLERTPPVDLNSADPAAIETLPGVGPAMAKRIVAHRDSVGGFRSLEAFCDVRGVGPGLAERLRPLVTFSGVPSPLSDACGGASKKPRKSRAATGRERS